MNGPMERQRLWLDCDPGHDDAIAIILAGYHPGANLMGVSTVFGNQELHKVTSNACMVLHYSGLDNQNVFPGQSRPLMRPLKTAAYIHGESGLDRINDEGDAESTLDSEQLSHVSRSLRSSKKAVMAMRDAVLETLKDDPEATLCIVPTGALTNVALFVTLFPELIPNIKVVCMGGCIGEGNSGSVVEFNFQIDPEAAKIVFESGVHLTMIPLEITNLAKVTAEIQSRLFVDGATSNFKRFIHEILMFFAKSYKEIYNFDDPPIHDPCAVFCALHPEFFQLDHLRVDIETCSTLSAGQSVCDIWRRSPLPPNCYVGRKMNLDEFWNAVIAAVEAADRRSPLNKENGISTSWSHKLMLDM